MSDQVSRGRLYALLCLMTFLWSVNYVVAKIALRHFPAVIFTPVRIQLATVLLLLLWRRHARIHGGTEVMSEWKRIALVGFLGIGVNAMAFLLGMGKTSVAHASLVIAMTPVLVLAFSALRAHESFTVRKVTGMALAFCGVLVLNLSPGRADRGATPLGDFLIFLAALTFAIYTVGGRNLTRRYGAIPVTALAYAASAIGLLPVLLWYSRGFNFGGVAATGWLTLIYMAIFPSVVCYVIYYHALSQIPATRVAAFSYSQPLIATLTGFVVLGEPVTTAVAIGGLLVLSGVWTTSRA